MPPEKKRKHTPGWKSLLKGDPLEWLLEPDNPSVRYLTLRNILEKPDSSSIVKKAKRGIMKTAPVTEILKLQSDDGTWGKPESFYTGKYKSTVWQLIILAALEADGNDERIRKACEFIMGHSMDRESGGYAMHRSLKSGGGRHSEVIACLTGNMLWALIRFGYVDDPGVKRGVDWIVRYQRFDDGIAVAPMGWPYDRFEICWGKHTCHMGVVKNLKALAEIPTEKRSQKVKATIEKCAEFLLIHHIHKRSHDLKKVSKPGWKKFGFPLMYQTDILEILSILTDLGYKDNRMQEAIDLLISKQNDQGRWIMENSFNDRTLIPVEKKGDASKWITLHALRVIKNYYSGNINPK